MPSSLPLARGAECLGIVTSDNKICYCLQLLLMRKDVIVDIDAPLLLTLPAHCLLIV